MVIVSFHVHDGIYANSMSVKAGARTDNHDLPPDLFLDVLVYLLEVHVLLRRIEHDLNFIQINADVRPAISNKVRKALRHRL